MLPEEYQVAYFFRSEHNLMDRKKVCDQYAKKFKTRLFKLDKTLKEPKINYLSGSEEEYEYADGLFIGDKIMR